MFRETRINYDPTNLYSDHFLRLNDDGTGATDNEKGGKRHWLTLTSDVDQTVWVIANTWDDHAAPTQCHSASDDERHIIEPAWGEYSYPFRYGSRILPAYQIKAGDPEWIKMDIHFGEDDARDWSIVVYGDKGPVTITHDEGLVTDKMPVIMAPAAPIPEP